MLEDKDKNFLAISGSTTKQDGEVGITRLSFRSQSMHGEKFKHKGRTGPDSIVLPNFIEKTITAEFEKEFTIA